MKKLIIVTVIIFILVCFFVIGYFLKKNDEKIASNDNKTDTLVGNMFVLQLPYAQFSMFDENKENQDKDIFIDEILTFEFKLVREKGKLYLLRTSVDNFMHLDHRAPWEFPPIKRIESGSRPRKVQSIRGKGETKKPVGPLPSFHKELWNVTFLQGNNIQIDGFIYDYYFTNQFKLIGTMQKSGIWRGSGIVNFGFGDKMTDEYRELLKINWQMFLHDQKIVEYDLLKKAHILKKIPLINDSKLPPLTDEEVMAYSKLHDRVIKNLPLIERSSITEAKYNNSYPEKDKLEKYFRGSDGRKKILYARDKILTDIDWSEIDNGAWLPEIFFAIDHLVIIEDDEVANHIATGQFREEKVIAIKYDWRSWSNIPLLFLFVYYNDWLTPERVAELSKLSNRIRLIIAEVKKYGNDSPNKLDEIMLSVLSKLSEQERRDYFVKSIKLRNYVKESNNLSLQKLMPNDLPPPPGPPENMRDWAFDNGQFKETFHGAFVRIEENNPNFVSKIVLFLDADRLEVRMRLRDLSKETQRYITEMLEAAAEDAAEAEKNKNTK
jgi:hypothetical protein